VSTSSSAALRSSARTAESPGDLASGSSGCAVSVRWRRRGPRARSVKGRPRRNPAGCAGPDRPKSARHRDALRATRVTSAARGGDAATDRATSASGMMSATQLRITRSRNSAESRLARSTNALATSRRAEVNTELRGPTLGRAHRAQRDNRWRWMVRALMPKRRAASVRLPPSSSSAASMISASERRSG
jgi:hypothetical protein